jgi:hypothetical protein
MLPVFVPHSVAQKILVIGKTINFLKICLPKVPKPPIGGDVPTVGGDGKGRKGTGSSTSIVGSASVSIQSPVQGKSPHPSYREINRSKRLTTSARVVDTLPPSLLHGESVPPEGTRDLVDRDGQADALIFGNKQVRCIIDFPAIINPLPVTLTPGQETLRDIESSLHSLRYSPFSSPHGTSSRAYVYKRLDMAER